MAKTPEESEYTSVHRRLGKRNTGLMPFDKGEQHATETGELGRDSIPIKFTEYLELLDWTGRQQRKEKRGAIESSTPPIVVRLGYTPSQWQSLVNPSIGWKQKAIGSAKRLRAYCEVVGQSWVWGISRAIGS